MSMEHIIKVYTKSGCDNCKKLKDYLEERKIQFIEISYNDLLRNKDLREQYRKLGLKTFPILVVDDVILSGFNPSLLDEVLWQRKVRE